MMHIDSLKNPHKAISFKIPNRLACLQCRLVLSVKGLLEQVGF